ncbi:MAG: hypothetical protein LBT00_03400 [Spirochaetaceae bacterium]|nr:hypothetical protein [Spirochaetaceae bacterium]
MSTKKKPHPSLRANPLSLRAKRSNPVEGLPRLDCFVADGKLPPPRNDDSSARHCERSEAIQ